MTISNISDKRILFRFFCEVDLKRVCDGIPWTFNRHLIIFHKMKQGEDPLQVPLIYSIFWVQIHNLPLGYMSKGMTRQFSNFIGTFLEYDAYLITRGVSKFMRIQVRIDVRLLLKRKKRIVLAQKR